ncbi:MAG: tandem-95 repeat protein, partial [Myxococcales bacterium]|nr:tandem-95 repeat protein [Myxococcales bacterium]
ISAAGLLTYTPAANANGVATVTVRIHDNGGTTNGGVDLSAAQTFTITVNAVNDAPSFTAGANQMVLEDAAAQTVAAWATAISAGPANESTQTVAFTVSATNSTMFSVQPAVSSTGTLTYTLAANANGTSTVTVTLADNGGGTNTSAPQTFTITVTAVNDAPSFTAGGNQSVNEDAGAQSVAWASAVSAGPNESGQTLTFSVSATNGTLFSAPPAISSTGTLTYTPAANASGSSTVTVSLQDNGGLANGGANTSGSVMFTITVNPINDPPSFTAGGNQSVFEDSGTTTVTNWASAMSPGPANESSQTLTFNVSTTNGTLFSTAPAVSSAGTLTFTPAANASGSATVTVTLQDNGGGADTSTPQVFTITVTGVNDAPSFTAGANQTVAEDAAAQTVTGWATNLSAGPNESQTLSFSVSNNANALFSSQPAVSSAGALTYTPAANANGVATVMVAIQDSGGTANGGVNTSASQMFTITIREVNDPPTTTVDTLGPINEDSGTFSILFSQLTGNDSRGPANESGQTLTVTGVTAVSGGSVSIANGMVNFTPTANFSGTASFTYTVQDNGTTNGAADPRSATGTASISVTAVDDAPVASAVSTTISEDVVTPVTLAYSDAENHQASSCTLGTVTNLAIAASCACTGGVCSVSVFGSPQHYNGSASFTYTVTANGLTSNTATASITVSPVNDRPTAISGSLTLDEDQSAPFAIDGDDVDQNTLSFTIATPPTNGTLSGIGAVDCNIAPVTACTAPITYTPRPNYNGPDSFTFTVSDGVLSHTGTITINVRSVNDTPFANLDTATTPPNTPVAIDVLANDTGLGDTPIVVTIVGCPTGSTCSVDALNRVVFTPGPNAFGNQNISYRITDVDGQSSSSRITVNVNGPAVAVDDVTETSVNKAQVVNVLFNDYDPEQDPFLIIDFSQAQNGMVTINPAKTALLYTPKTGFCDPVNGDKFEYQITGGAKATVVVKFFCN